MTEALISTSHTLKLTWHRLQTATTILGNPVKQIDSVNELLREGKKKTFQQKIKNQQKTETMTLLHFSLKCCT